MSRMAKRLQHRSNKAWKGKAQEHNMQSHKQKRPSHQKKVKVLAKAQEHHNQTSHAKSPKREQVSAKEISWYV